MKACNYLLGGLCLVFPSVSLNNQTNVHQGKVVLSYSELELPKRLYELHACEESG